MSAPVMLLQATLSHKLFPTPRTHSAHPPIWNRNLWGWLWEPPPCHLRLAMICKHFPHAAQEYFLFCVIFTMFLKTGFRFRLYFANLTVNVTVTVSVSFHSCSSATCYCMCSNSWTFPHSPPIHFSCTHFHFHSCPMTNLLMKPQIAIVPCSVFTISTITFRLFMLLLYMIHRSVGHFSPKFTFSAELPFSNRILKNRPKYKFSHHVAANTSSCHPPISPLLTALDPAHPHPPPRLPPPPPSPSPPQPTASPLSWPWPRPPWCRGCVREHATLTPDIKPDFMPVRTLSSPSRYCVWCEPLSVRSSLHLSC